ncbi:MAG: diaminopimelate decarboxylase [Lachnospiraceae bacterium]
MEEKVVLSRDYAKTLTEQYGSPLYVYDEEILRRRCKEVKDLLKYENYVPNYSAKANSNIELLKIIRSEGLTVDAMSMGEIELELAAGYTPSEILFISNNVTESELRYALDKGVKISVDSVSQLELFGQIAPGGKVAFRLNPGIGAGHHAKVITGGKSKFGITEEDLPQVLEIVKKYDLTVMGINQHIGSLFLDDEVYLASCERILECAMQFPDLEFIDFGGGFGIPYKGEDRLNMKKLGVNLNELVEKFVSEYGRRITIKVEPGRYVVAECGHLLGTVTAVKTNFGDKYVGTDIGFNVLMRPILYGSHHDIIAYNDQSEQEEVTVVGNICESGDKLCEHRLLPKMQEGDIIGVKDAGAYCYSMASNYNARLRPAEVLVNADGCRLIRRADTVEDLFRQF